MNPTAAGTKLLLVAFDGLSFPLLEKLSGAGDLPFFKALMERGCYALLKPFTPSNSAVIWTSVMTGMHPRKHGIDSFIYYTAGGRVLRKTTVKKLLKCGARPLFNWLKKKHYVRDHPFSLSMVRQKMIWDLFAEQGRSAGILNWWHSWPVPQIPGFAVSDRVHYWRSHERHDAHHGLQDAYLVHPPHLADEVVSRVINPFELPVEVYQQFMHVDKNTVHTMKDSHYERHQLMSEFKYLYAMDESVRQIGMLCLRALPQPDFSAIYFRGIDIISHCALQYTPENRDASVSDEAVRQFGETVSAYYRYSDAVLGEITGAVSPDTAVVVVSDHGFEREPDGRFGHRRTRPPGLLIAAGVPFKGGSHPVDVTLYDIAPTLLYLAGLPTSLEMDGRVLTECIEESFLRSHPCSSVDSYGPPLLQRAPVSPESEEEIKERLRALGYID